MTSKGSDQTARMRRLVGAFAGRIYHIVGNPRLRLIWSLIDYKMLLEVGSTSEIIWENKGKNSSFDFLFIDITAQQLIGSDTLTFRRKYGESMYNTLGVRTCCVVDIRFAFTLGR